MGLLRNPSLRLRALLWAVALHSVAVSVGLVLQPAGVLARAGYQPVSEPFFPAQGGIFHLVMALAYAMAAADLRRNRMLVVFAVLVKIVATAFLLGYWIFASRVFAVLASGLADGAMALLLLLAYRSWRAMPAQEVV